MRFEQSEEEIVAKTFKQIAYKIKGKRAELTAEERAMYMEAISSEERATLEVTM